MWGDAWNFHNPEAAKIIKEGKKNMSKQYEFRMRCSVDKVIMVEAETEDEAVDKANSCNWSDERDDGLNDWEITSGPKDMS